MAADTSGECKRPILSPSQTLKIGTMEFVEAWTSPEGSQVVRLVTSPDFGAWVPKALQSQASFQKLEFHDVRSWTCGRAHDPVAGRRRWVGLCLALFGAAVGSTPSHPPPLPPQIIEYAPSDLARPPYSLSVCTESPMLGHKVRSMRSRPGNHVWATSSQPWTSALPPPTCSWTSGCA